MGSRFNKFPVVPVAGKEKDCVSGWQQIETEMRKALERLPDGRRIVCIETYQGVYLEDLKARFSAMLRPHLIFDTGELIKSEAEIRKITQVDVTDDRVFGYMTRLRMEDLLDMEKLKEAGQKISAAKDSLILIFGYGASLVWEEPEVLIYADMPRWEIQQRMRGNKVNNLGIRDLDESAELKYKRAYFVDWRICDRIKKETISRWDYVLDTTQEVLPKMVKAEAFKEGLRQAVRRPFSVVPFFDPGPWGGQWMKEKFGLDQESDNFAWCFNCVPEENSLLMGFGEITFETPSINLVFFQAADLLGDPVHGMFGEEFPIRFDFLDTMEGGNLSLQVHPLTAYIQEKFGMHYTQDESYYLLDAGGDGSVYLGLKEGIHPSRMIEELHTAEREGSEFEVENYVERWPAKKHDHFLIPAGTVHCSGRNGMVLEISATPYIFTFKLYDWGRVNADGQPRPINVDHGVKNIQWDRTTRWTGENLVNQVEPVREGDGWREERTGLHRREFIETRRHWFRKPVLHHSGGGVNVLTLVEGEEAVVESPGGRFEPLVIHYAETFIVPAALGEYSIRPHGPAKGKECATVKAYVRINP